MNADLDTLREAAEALEARLAALPSLSQGGGIAAWGSSLSRRHNAIRDLVGWLQRDLGGRVTSGSHGHRIALHGITATGTEGPDGAIRNWIAAARRRLQS